MADNNIEVSVIAYLDNLIREVHRIAVVDVPHLELAADVATMPDPEVIVAGIEGRAIVRSRMQRELAYIGEA